MTSYLVHNIRALRRVSPLGEVYYFGFVFVYLCLSFDQGFYPFCVFVSLL